MPNRFSLPPVEQQHLREACVQGNVEEALRLLDPKDSGLMGSVRGLVGTTPKKAVASLDYVYTDDSRNSVVHYLCGAKVPVKGVYVLFQWLDRFCYSCRSSAQRNDEGRAQLVLALINAGFQLDFSTWNAKKQGIVHFCVTSNSVQVLRAVLDVTHAEGFNPERRPDVQLVDHDGRSPLHHALEQRNFEMVKLLIAAGALNGLIQPLSELVAAGMMEAPTSDALPAKERHGSNRLWAGAFEKRRKIKELEKRLAESEKEGAMTEEVQVMTEPEVQDTIFKDVETLCMDRSLDPSSALTLLAEHEFRLHTALKADQIEKKRSNKDHNPDGDRCIVCFEDAFATSTQDQSIQLPCGHQTCNSCWKRILKERLEDGDVLRTMCPEPGCCFRLPLLQVARLLGPEEEAHFMHLFYLRYVDFNPDMSWCPGTDCGRVLRMHESERISAASPVSVQCSCKHSCCLVCHRDSHEPATCSQVEEWMSVLDVVLTEKRSLEWVKAETVRCPRCQTPIERDGGCNHMSCTVCHQQFCYQCGRKWKGHSDHYTCTLASIISENERAPKPRRLCSKMKGLTAKFKPNSLRASFEWHLQQYLKHNPDEVQLRSVAEYMVNLLRETTGPVEKATAERIQEGPQERTDDERCEDEGDAFEYIGRWLEVLLTAERMLRNSYILSFKLRNGSSRKKFLTNLIEQLESSVQMLKSCFTSFPALSEIRRRGDGNAVDMPFTQISSDFSKQFFFAHSLHTHQKKLDDICSNVLQNSDRIRRASRLHLFHHTKPHKKTVPAATSLELPSS